MPQTAPAVNYAFTPLQPRYVQPYAATLPINLAPSTTFVAGQVLLQVGATQNDVQTVAETGSPGGGTFTLTGYNPVTGLNFTTGNIAQAATSAALQTELQKAANFGAGNVTVSGSAGGTWTLTFVGNLAGVPVPILVLGTNALTGGSTPSITIVHATLGRTAGTYGPYSGSGTAMCLLKYACQTDAAGNISYSSTNTTGEWGQTSKTNIAYFSGVFSTADLTGLDSGAVTALGRLWSGTTTSGELSVR